MQELKDAVKFFGVFGVLVVAVVLGAVRLGQQWQCAAYSDATGLETKTQALTCYINGGDRWYAWDEWKLRGATKGQ